MAATATTSGDVSKLRGFVETWAAGHPITGTIAARQPILSIDIKNELPNAMTVGQAAAEVANSLDDIEPELEVYSGQVVRQARWEVERQTLGVLNDLSAKEAIPLAARAVASAERAAADISRLVPAVEGAAHTAERAADIVATERQAAVSAISADLRPHDRLRAARTACGPRILIPRAKKQAIDDLRTTITEEHEALVTDTQQVADRLVDRAMDRLERLVLKVVGMLLIAAFAALVMMRLLFRRPNIATRAAI